MPDCCPPAPAAPPVYLPRVELPILYASDACVAIEKPSGLLSVPGKGPDKQDCAAARVRAMFPSAQGPLVVHRLDMETSGILLFGLTPHAQRDLSMQFERRAVDKIYAALLEGLLDTDAGEVRLPMRPDIDRRPYQIVDFIHGQPAITRYTVLARETDRTRVRFVPLTGKTHQLRVHAATPRDQGGLGAPIIGDRLYSSNPTTDRLMLHAAFLSFIDPGTGQRVDVTSPTPF